MYLVANPTSKLQDVAKHVGVSYSVLQRLASIGLLDAALNAQLAALDSNDAATDVALMLAETAAKRREVVSIASNVVDILYGIVQAGAPAARRGFRAEVDEDGVVDPASVDVPTEKSFLAAANILTRLGEKFLTMHEARALGVDADGVVDANPSGEVRIVLEGFEPAPTVRRFDDAEVVDVTPKIEGPA